MSVAPSVLACSIAVDAGMLTSEVRAAFKMWIRKTLVPVKSRTNKIPLYVRQIAFTVSVRRVRI